MLSTTKLMEERDEKRLAFSSKYEQKYLAKKQLEIQNNKTKVDEFAKSHSLEETKRYQKNLEDDSILRLNKLLR